MNNNPKTKVQNRITLVTIVLLMSIAAALIVMTAVQDRRADPSPREIPDSAGDTADSEKSTETTVTTPDMRGSDPETENREKSTDAMEQEGEVTPVISEQPEDVLPHFISPVNGSVAYTYSVDVPVYSITMEDYRTHGGVDIAAADGSAVRATADGVIEEIWEEPMMGTCLSVSHSGGAKSVYKNLSPVIPENITPGTVVKAGEVVAAVGESALCEIAQESHLHYELFVDGVSVDPQDYMLIGTVETSYDE